MTCGEGREPSSSCFLCDPICIAPLLPPRNTRSKIKFVPWNERASRDVLPVRHNLTFPTGRHSLRSYKRVGVLKRVER